MIEGDGIRVTVTVGVDPEAAFRIFTEEIDSWWRRGPRFRGAPGRDGVLRFEPGVGGRLVEEDGGESFEIGRILVWQPGERLVFEWRGRNFEPDQITEVEVRFEAMASGTRVQLEHRGWDELPDDHPARHGLDGGAFASLIGVWWADLLTALRRHGRASSALAEGDFALVTR